MQTPANFDNLGLDGLLSDWVSALSEFSVEAVVVLGPNPIGEPHERNVMAVHPPVLLDVATALAESADYGVAWSESDAPMVAWQHIAKAEQLSACRWRVLAMAHGFQTLVRVEFSLPMGRAFECFMLSPRELNNRSEAAALVWSALNIWPLIKRAIAASTHLTPRERECLAMAFAGLTARACSERLKCSERTVNYHLANAMTKLRVENKLAAIQRACWMGAI
jgi:LuxR family transcriptional regulator, quorum-sensing system regulator SolR